MTPVDSSPWHFRKFIAGFLFWGAFLALAATYRGPFPADGPYPGDRGTIVNAGEVSGLCLSALDRTTEIDRWPDRPLILSSLPNDQAVVAVLTSSDGPYFAGPACRQGALVRRVLFVMVAVGIIGWAVFGTRFKERQANRRILRLARSTGSLLLGLAATAPLAIMVALLMAGIGALR